MMKLNRKELTKLHKWLRSESKNYICMIADGSIATKDKWIKGRSDRDILLIFEKITKEDLANLRTYLSRSNFDNSYLFNPFTKRFFIKNKKNDHTFSGKFRSKVIYGEDIIKDVKLPNKKDTEKIYKRGLLQVQRRLDSRIINSGFWSIKKIRKVFRRLFKQAFMNLAIKAYHDFSKYPSTREEVGKYYNSPDLTKALEVLNNIDKKSKKEIVESANKLNKWLENLK